MALALVPAGRVGAQLTTLPRLLPGTVPQGFVLTGLDDSSSAPGRATYLVIDQSPDRSRRVISQSAVYGGAAQQVVQDLWDDVVSSPNDRRTSVHRQRAVAFGDDGVGWTVVWAEGQDVLSVDDVSPRATFTSVTALAATVKPTRLADGSFTMAPQPKGTVRLFAGSQRRLYSGEQYTLTYSSLEADVEISVLEADPLLISVAEGDSVVMPTTVRARPGVLYDDGEALNLSWMEGPRTMVSVSSADLNDAGLRQFAEALAPVDAAAFADAGVAARSTILPGSTDVVTTVGSGLLDGVAWSARPTVSATGERCLQFESPGVRAVTCLATASVVPSLVWMSSVVGDRRTAFGITTAGVASVSVRDRAGNVLARASTTAVTGDSSVRVFAVQFGSTGLLTPVADGAAVVVGLDAAGIEVVPARPVSPLR